MPRRLTVAQAADALGITETAVRQRIGRQTLPVEREGGRITVVLPDAPTTLPDMPPADAPARQTETSSDAPAPQASPGQRTDASDPRRDAAVTALLTIAEAAMRRAERAEREKAEYAAASAMWQERAANLEAENARLHELLALPAHEPAPVAWWRRIWRRR